MHGFLGKGLLIVLAAVFLTALAQTAAACPSCKEALGNSSGGGDLVSGFFWSILFMLSMPFTLLTLFALYCYWQIRKARLEQEASKA
jgi:heme/copper-type cytochrome/quinol oxidase subunit 2